jgi:hypothetical protein
MPATESKGWQHSKKVAFSKIMALGITLDVAQLAKMARQFSAIEG